MTRTTITRLPHLASRDRTALDELLDSALVGHLALVVDGSPVVLPTAVARLDDQVIVHGSTGSRWMRLAASGVPVSLAVTTLDGLEVARSAFESSLHYRSAVLFGSCSPVTSRTAKLAALDRLTETLLPGRVAEIRRPSGKELAATLVLALPIVEWSLKVSAGWPDDEDDDIAGDAWAGVVPLIRTFAAPRAAPDLRSGIPVPASVSALGVALTPLTGERVQWGDARG